MAADKPLAVVLVDEGYEDLEVHYPLLRLKEAGYHVEVVGDKAGHNYNSKHGYWAKSTKIFTDIDASKVKVLIVPGGWAPDRLRRWKDCLKLVADINATGAVVGAFYPLIVLSSSGSSLTLILNLSSLQLTSAMAAGFPLGMIFLSSLSAKIMNGKKSTCFVAIKDDIINAGAEYSEERCVVDGNMCVYPCLSFVCPYLNVKSDLPMVFNRKGCLPRLQMIFQSS